MLQKEKVMSKKEIELIERQIEKLNDPHFNVDSWKSATNIILSRIFGQDYEGIKSINKIKHSTGGIFIGGSSSNWDNIETCKKQGREILKTCISELETFGLPEKQTKENGINITLTQNQTVNVNFLTSALEDELTVSQLKEVKDIMQANEPKEKKKEKIIDKLRSFGGDVASNILANILTNPNIWG
ncbi:MAG: hypothetical protein O9302_01320 [Cyclobacteriaceae bacterium]|jgi:hypothetical protein|nr:hypothetical protein [Cytophagales bacterium]MCZ8326671.1 hypothetical protein [Cyclobacteriaceae bacterium]